MRVVFMGTPHFAEVVLEHLIESKHDVVAVVTMPDAVRGRGKKLVSTPVKECAQKHDIPVWPYSSLRSDEAYEQVKDCNPDVICVAAYGAILPKRILDIPQFGCLNVHGSLLPRWRGAAPVERAILAGDMQTGIGIMRMEEGLDTGPTAQVECVAIGQTKADELSAQLAQVGGAALVEVLDRLDQNEALIWTDQPEEGVTYAEKIEKGELNINPELSCKEVLLRVQASGQTHPSRCTIAHKRVTVLSLAQSSEEELTLLPGEVCFRAKRLYLGCRDGVVELLELKPDGKNSMDAKAFAAGIQGIKQQGSVWSSLDE